MISKRLVACSEHSEMAAHDGEDIQASTFLLEVLQAPLELIKANEVLSAGS